jgi:hypothetical protein
MVKRSRSVGRRKCVVGAEAHRRDVLWLVVVACVSLSALVVPAAASAAFKRSFVRQMTQTAAGGRLEPGGVAVDLPGNLWVSESRRGKLSEFDTSGAGLQYMSLTFVPPTLEESATRPESLAIDLADGDFFVTGAGTYESFPPRVEVFDESGHLMEQWSKFGAPAHIAIDNATSILEDPSACVTSLCAVYVSHGKINPSSPNGDGEAAGIEKFDTSGKPVAFTGSASYISGNTVDGVPGEPFGGVASTPIGIAVGPHGEFYTADVNPAHPKPLVDEFEASGLYVKAIDGESTPGIDGNHGEGGFGGGVRAVAVDPLNGNVTVAAYSASQHVGVIDEFSVSGAFLSQIAETEEGLVLGEISEMTFAANGQLYAVDKSAEAVDVFDSGSTLPGVSVAEASARQSTSALLAGAVNPEESEVGECYFEYVAEAEYEPLASDPYAAGAKAVCEPPPADIPPNAAFNAVQAHIGGLVPGITYRYRLVVTTNGPFGGTNASFGLSFTAPGPPTVDSVAVTNISSAFAEVTAHVNPRGADTSYVFQYVEDAQYSPAAQDPYASGGTAPASGFVDIGAGAPTGNVDIGVAQPIGNLRPNTIYHFRIVAMNTLEGVELGATASADETFTTTPAGTPTLPDGRAYELVTPPNKGSAEDMFAAPETERHSFFNSDIGYASESGDGFLLVTRAAFGQFPASGGNAYVLSRIAGAWRSQSLASSGLGVQSVGLAAFQSKDLSKVGLDTTVGSFGSVSGSHELSLVGPPSGPYENVYVQTGGADPVVIAGASYDLSRLVLESTNHDLLAAAAGQQPGSHVLYGWSGGALELLNVDSDGAPVTQCGAILGQGEFAGGSHDAVSPDASRVVFTAPDPYAVNDGAGCWNGGGVNTPQLYVRSGGKTIEISNPAPGVLEEGHAPTMHTAKYVGASEDTTKIFFMTETEITEDVATLKLHDEELYEYDSQSETVTHVSAGEAGSPVTEAGSSGSHVFTVPAIASDASAVYFNAFGQLTSNAPPVSGKQINLYRYDVAQSTIAYVATVSERDYPNSKAGSPFGIEPGLQSELALDPQASWYTTPDGRYLLFASESELTGYNTSQPDLSDCPDPLRKGEPHSGHCSEIYRYDSVSHSMRCLSCDLSGAAPVSNAFFAQAAGGPTRSSGSVRAMSDDGSTVFFETADPLASADGNGTLDVYEWRNGEVSLISSGQDAAPSYFLGTDAAGENAFFGTHARLVPIDIDTAGDVYDARICTAADPCIKPPVPPTAACEGDACQSPPPSPIDATPESLTFSGAGNISTVAVPPVKVTNVQKLAKALKVCRAKLKHARRKACEARARKRYGAKHAKRATSKRGGSITRGSGR